MGGLPVALFLTAEGDLPRQLRASVIAYFFLLDITGLIFLARESVITSEMLSLAVICLPVVALGVWLGGKRFLGTTPDSFRRTTLVMLMAIATIGILRGLWML